MIRFILQVELEGEIGQGFRKIVEWPALPRVGEHVKVLEDLWPVKEISHDLGEPGDPIFVLVEGNEPLLRALKDEPGWVRI